MISLGEVRIPIIFKRSLGPEFKISLRRCAPFSRIREGLRVTRRVSGIPRKAYSVFIP